MNAWAWAGVVVLAYLIVVVVIVWGIHNGTKHQEEGDRMAARHYRQQDRKQKG